MKMLLKLRVGYQPDFERVGLLPIILLWANRTIPPRSFFIDKSQIIVIIMVSSLNVDVIG